MPDYPDWQRAFRIVGTEITIPISIETSTVTLNVNIASAVTLHVDITAQSVGNLNVNLAASAITLNVNLAAQTANISIKFADQSVAVFDAAKWFAHQAQQVFLAGGVDVANNTYGVVASRTVPVGRTFYITGMSHTVRATTAGPLSMWTLLHTAVTNFAYLGSYRGGGIAFDTPIAVPAGISVSLYVGQYGSGATLYCEGGFWGYDEVA